MRRKIQEFPFYLFLLPVFFVFHGFTENFYSISAGSSLLLLTIYTGSLLLLTGLFYIFYKNLSKASLLATFVMAFNFFFGNIHDLLKRTLPGTFIIKYTVLLTAFLVACVIVFIILKKRKTLFKLTAYLNILFTALILIDFFLLIGKIAGNEYAYQGKNPGLSYTNCDTCTKPDIYIILLDEYAGEEEFRDLFNATNQPFFDSLSARGFNTIMNSSSNYNYTPYSTASTLTMDYMDTLKTANPQKGYKYVLNQINNNNVIHFLLANGYTFFNASVFTVAGQDPQIGGSIVPVNTDLITEGTFVNRLQKDVLLSLANKLNIDWYIKRSLYSTYKVNNILYELTKKTAELKSKQPKAVYTHLLMPHFPYYYNEKGEFRSFAALKKSRLYHNEDYLSYLKYTNTKMIGLIDHILAHSETSPVIALISDHGYRHYPNSSAKYYFTNLLSIRLPGQNYNQYSDSLSNVNFFRVFLNSQFNQQLPLLEEKRFLIDF